MHNILFGELVFEEDTDNDDVMIIDGRFLKCP